MSIGEGGTAMAEDEVPFVPHDTNLVTDQGSLSRQGGFYTTVNATLVVVTAVGKSRTLTMVADKVKYLKVTQILDTGSDAVTVYVRVTG